ncbi:MAG: hypothetical protein FWC60_09190 [Firmicutes bacterium]|nr:hypothetical protein [Bacillota bacterium]
MSKKFVSTKTKTPIQEAMDRIKTAYIMAFISAALTLIMIILSILGVMPINGINAFSFIDLVIIIVLAVLLVTLKSRVASIILLVYFLANQIIIRLQNPGTIRYSSLFMTIMFTVAYIYGIWGTFSYHKLKKQEALVNETNETEKTVLLD